MNFIPHWGIFAIRVLAVRPKRVKRTNGQVLTPEMEITVTTKSNTCDPFYNGAKEIQEQYMRMYQFDYKKSCCSKADFEFKQLDWYLNEEGVSDLIHPLHCFEFIELTLFYILKSNSTVQHKETLAGCYLDW